MTYPEIIKEVRTQLKLSQEELARELKVSFSTINRWETGKSTPSKMAKRLLIEFCKNKKVINNVITTIENV